MEQALAEGGVANQYLHTTLSPNVALYIAEHTTQKSKQQIVEIDLEGFSGEVIDVSDPYGCSRHGIKHHKAYHFAVKHKVVMLRGYVQPSRLGKVLNTAPYRLNVRGYPSFEDSEKAVPPFVLQEVKSYWRYDPAWARCRKLRMQEAPDQAWKDDDAVHGGVLKRESERLAEQIAKLEVQKKLIDAQSWQIQERTEKEARRKEEERLQKLEQERAEQQRLEERKRKREEEERRQEKYLAEERRGPRIWACCTEQDHLLQYFDRAALQVALGRSGYITLWDRAKGHSWSGIPNLLYNKINSRGYHQSHATLVALSPDSDNYYVQFSDGTASWVGPDSFTNAIQNSGRLSVVAFGPSGSWFVEWPSGAWQHEGLPRSLSNMLNSNRHRSVAILSISGKRDEDDFSDIDEYYELIHGRQDSRDSEPAWFIRWEDGKHPAWKLMNQPADLSETVDEVQQRGAVRSIEFGKHGEWVLRYSD
eukprot:CAMPEP_0181417478 /NCGR_PEP_ID=MMETSP1110-20121109/11062_1 /TAXON_ID=174948 /ORGANISM="Symbiodinium sp., Strain CCMP421" /LENGTH=475 /DNA_ID=CAMNT_0023540431 /DNA_START=84 /DNA_END=1512 /DNA_ORIENTATION=+